MSEQRIVKAVSGTRSGSGTSEAAIHYHYDGEGRLISETDASTGETVRAAPLPWSSPPKIDSQDRFLRVPRTVSEVWLGLTPIASFGPANDNTPTEDCSDEIAALEADIADRTGRIDRNAARIARLGGLITDRQTRIANNDARISELEGLITDKQSRMDNNAARITELGGLVTDKQSRIDANSARITELKP